MAYFEKRKKAGNFLYTKTAVVILVAIAAFLGFSVYSVFQKRQEARTNAKTAEYEVMTLRESEAKTKLQIEKLGTEAGVEEAIRNKYRAAKSGEGLVVITEESRRGITAPVAPQEEKESWWQRFLGIFSKR